MFKKTDHRNDSITIGWDKVPGAVGYAVYGSKAGKSYKKLSDVTGTSFKQKDQVRIRQPGRGHGFSQWNGHSGRPRKMHDLCVCTEWHLQESKGDG